MNFFTPAEVAKNYIATGKSKVNTPIPKMIILAILAGAFIGFGGVGPPPLQYPLQNRHLENLSVPVYSRVV